MVLQHKDTVEVLRRGLARLSPAHAEVIDLVYYHGKSFREVAEIVGISEATVKTLPEDPLAHGASVSEARGMSVQLSLPRLAHIRPYFWGAAFLVLSASGVQAEEGAKSPSEVVFLAAAPRPHAGRSHAR